MVLVGKSTFFPKALAWLSKSIKRGQKVRGGFFLKEFIIIIIIIGLLFLLISLNFRQLLSIPIVIMHSIQQWCAKIIT